jgi:DNA-binding CsgD family transcriptional regulator
MLHKAPSRIVNVSINSTRLRGPFDEHDGERLRPLIPHLRRALEIKDRLESQHIRHDTVVKCLDNACVAVVLLDEGGRVVEASSSAAALMCASNGIDRDADGTLWVRGPAGVVLNEWITKGMPPARNGDGLLHIPRPPSGPLSIMVTRLPVMSTPWLSGSSPCWMLLLFDPDRQILASAELIARDLGLSLREAELAAMLVNACDITVVAQRLHISINTARTHLKSIYSKMGIGSQAELVRRITSGPAGRRTGG